MAQKPWFQANITPPAQPRLAGHCVFLLLQAIPSAICVLPPGLAGTHRCLREGQVLQGRLGITKPGHFKRLETLS